MEALSVINTSQSRPFYGNDNEVVCALLKFAEVIKADTWIYISTSDILYITYANK